MGGPGARVATLVNFLQAAIRGASDLDVVGFSALSGGNARSAWSFDLTWRTDGVQHTKECVLLLREEAGQLERELAPEFATLAALEGSGVPAPRALWCDPEGKVLGNPGFVMERVPGASDLRGLLDPAEHARNAALAEGMAVAAAALHQVDWQARDLRVFGSPTPEEAALREVAYWEALFLAHRMEPLPALVFAFSWLRDNAPVTPRVTIVHGDFRFGNLIYEGTTLRALLDWEMAHLGDPCEDLAWAYRRLWSPGAALPFDAFLARYDAAGGAPLSDDRLRFYRLFGEVKHAVISLTGASAFASGRTTNLRLADRMTWVPECLIEFLDVSDGP